MQRATGLAAPIAAELLRCLDPHPVERSASRLQRRDPFALLDPAGWPWDLDMDDPPYLDTIAPECERQWAARTRGDLDYRITVPKWAFLQYLVARHDILLHGSGTSGIHRLEPVSRSWGGSRITGQPGLFAVDHALMAMYSASSIGHRTPYMSNGLKIRTRPNGRRERRVHLGVEFVGLAARPFRDATGSLPRETFSRWESSRASCR